MNHFNPNISLADQQEKRNVFIINEEKDCEKQYTYEEALQFCRMLAKRDRLTSASFKDSPITMNLQTPPFLGTDHFDDHSPIPIKDDIYTHMDLEKRNVNDSTTQDIKIESSKYNDGDSIDLRNNNNNNNNDTNSSNNHNSNINSEDKIMNFVGDIKSSTSSTSSTAQLINHNQNNSGNLLPLPLPNSTSTSSSSQSEANNTNTNTPSSSLNQKKDEITSTTTTPTSTTTTAAEISSSSLKIDEKKIYWLDFEGLDQEEIGTICKVLCVHHLTYEDIISHDSTEKSEEYSNYLFVSTSELTYSRGGELINTSIYLLIFQSFVIVFHQEPLDCFDHMIKSFKYLDSKGIKSSPWVLYSMLDSICELYATHADYLMAEVHTLDDFTIREEVAQNELYVRLGRATRKSTNLLSWLFIKNDTLSSLLRNSISEETKRHLRNIKDRVVRIQQKIKLAEELLENVNNVYISKVSLLLNEESHTLNMSMSRFTTLTLIFMPLNLIAGIFGMNVKVPGMVNYYDDNQFKWFACLMTFFIIWIIGTGLYFKRLGWL